MRPDKCEVELECVLTDKEKLVYGKELAQNLNKVVELEGQLSRFKDSIKGEMTTCETKASALSRKLETGKEFRMVACRIERDWKAKTRRWIRQDTLEVAKEDIIPEHELQEELELQEKINAKAQKKANKKAAEGSETNV